MPLTIKKSKVKWVMKMMKLLAIPDLALHQVIGLIIQLLLTNILLHNKEPFINKELAPTISIKLIIDINTEMVDGDTDQT
jgi:hypothetical protein